jgi:uncharacterized protein involved in exopolysaccharide biosynthesis/Mrp family chromosome partitioning ATPase
VRGFLDILARHWRTIALATLLSLGLALGYLALAAPVYTASTTLFIDPRLKKIVSEEVTQGGLGSDLALVESQVAIIGSDAVLNRVVDRLKLDQDPEFAPPPGPGLLSRLKALVVSRPAPPDPKLQALESLARSIKVKRAQKTYVVDIEASAGTPVKAARITEAVVEAYLLDQTEAKQSEAKRANELIDARLGELREQVRRAELRADEFRKSNRILTSEGGLVNEQQLSKLNGELITARAVAAEANARLDQVNAALKAGAGPDTLPDALRSGLVQRLREQYAQVARREAALSSQLQGRHPVLIEVRSQVAEIRNQIAAELKRIATSARSEQQIAQNRERDISAQLERAKSEVGRTNTAQIKLRELEQELTASRELLRVFLGRAKELQEQQSIATSDARVISPAAVPTQPSKPLTWLILSLGLLGGLGLGIAGALVNDQLDRSVRSPGDIAAASGLAALGVVPRFSAPARGASATDAAAPLGGRRATPFGDLLTAIADARGPAAVTYRQSLARLQSRLRTHDAGRSGRAATVMLIAPHRGAGASATALGLAYSAALQGERVLLVDASSSDAELSTIFAGSISTDRVVVLDDRDHLAAITARDARSGLALLPIALADLRTLKSHQRRKLVTGLTALSQGYDLVVIDGGALLADDSSAALLPCADSIVVVARSGATSADQIAATVDMLNGARDRIAGVVLTMTEPGRP